MKRYRAFWGLPTVGPMQQDHIICRSGGRQDGILEDERPEAELGCRGKEEAATRAPVEATDWLDCLVGLKGAEASSRNMSIIIIIITISSDIKI